MLEKLLNLKKTSKILFYLLIPLVVAAAIMKLIMQFNLYGAKKDLDKAEKKDTLLKTEQEELQAKASIHIKQAKEHNSKAKEHEKNAESEEVDLNWNKKK